MTTAIGSFPLSLGSSESALAAGDPGRRDVARRTTGSAGRALWSCLILIFLCRPAPAQDCLYGPPFQLEAGIQLYDRQSHAIVGQIVRYETNRRMDDGTYHNAALVQLAGRRYGSSQAWLSREYISEHFAVRSCGP